MSNLWSVTLTNEQYNFCVRSCGLIEAPTYEKDYVRVGLTIERVRELMRVIDYLVDFTDRHPRQDISQGDLAEIYLNFSDAFGQYEDFLGLV